MRNQGSTSPRGVALVALLAAVLSLLAASISPATALAEDASSDEVAPMYRLYNQWNGDHMFTLDSAERDNLVSLGWSDEGVAWEAPADGTAVYRLYNQWSGEHLFTADVSEYDQLGSIGWSKEGVAFHSAGEDGVPIRRLYNKWLTAGTHLYSTDEDEYENLCGLGWAGEGVFFYGARSDQPDNPDAPSDTHHVRFVTDEGGEERVLKEDDVPNGAETFAPTTPSRDGYEFRGWNTEDDGSGTAWTSGTTATADVTYYTVWAPVAPAEETEDGQTTSGLRYDDGVKAVEGEASADGTSATVSQDEAKGIEAGDIVVLNADDPDDLTAIKVTKVSDEGGEAKIEGAVPDITEVFQDAHIEGKAAMSADNMILADGITAENVGTELATSDDGSITLPKIHIKLSLTGKAQGTPSKWSSYFPNSSFSERHSASLELSGTYDATVSGWVSWQAGMDGGALSSGAGITAHIESASELKSSIKGSGKVHLAIAKVAPGVYVDFDLAFDAQGNATLTTSATDEFGFELTSSGVSFPRSHSGTTEFQAEGSANAGLSVLASAGVGNLAMIGAEGNLGAHGEGNVVLRSTGMRCADVSANLYLNFGFDAKLKLMLPFLESTSVGATADIDFVVWDADDTPWKVSQHFENGKKVDACTWKSYEVVFSDPVGNATVTTASVGKGEAIQPFAPDAPEHDGWEFVRWENSETGEELTEDTKLGAGAARFDAVYKRTRELGRGCSVEEDTKGNLRIYPTNGTSGTMDKVTSLRYFTSVRSITIDEGVKAPGNSNNLFGDLNSLTSLDANNLDTSGAYSLAQVFYEDSSLKDLSGVASWDVSGVTDFQEAFGYCKKLESLSGLEKWDVSGASDEYGMRNMFSGCTALYDLSALAGWDVSNVTCMESLFSGCESLEALTGLEEWDVSHVLNGQNAFGGCSSLRDISALAGWDVSRFTTMEGMFSGCSVLADLTPLSSWNLYNVTDISSMFHDCARIKSLDGLDNWDLSHMTDMTSLFSGCSRLSDISALSSWKLSNSVSISSLFSDCKQLSNVDALATWDTSGVTNLNALFYNCASLSDLSGLANWDVSHVTTMSNTFEGCSSLRNVDSLATWNTASLQTIGSRSGVYRWGIFKDCTYLESVEGLRNWDVSNLTSCEAAFYNCTFLKDFSPLENWNMPDGVSTTDAFSGCPGTPPSWYQD